MLNMVALITEEMKAAEKAAITSNQTEYWLGRLSLCQELLRYLKAVQNS